MALLSEKCVLLVVPLVLHGGWAARDSRYYLYLRSRALSLEPALGVGRENGENCIACFDILFTSPK